MAGVLPAPQRNMTHGMQPFRETLVSEQRRLRDRSRRDGSGSARDRTVSEASHRTISPWAQWVWESSSILWAWIVQWYWHIATRWDGRGAASVGQEELAMLFPSDRGKNS